MFACCNVCLAKLYFGSRSGRRQVGRSILAELLAMILAISHVSNNPTPSDCQSLFIIFAPRHHCCLAAVSKGERGGGTLSQQGPC